MKKCLSCLLVLLVLTLLPMFAIEAQAAETSGTCGENLTWTLDEEGTLTISGSGPMENSWGGAPWYAYGADILTIKIEDGITSIGARAFSNCISLIGVTIPDSVSSIGNFAFSGCTSLTSVSIPDGVTSIGYSAFEDCASLTSMTIPDSVTSIDRYAFDGCTGLDGFWVDENNPNYLSDEHGVLIDKTKLELIDAPRALNGQYSIPDSVTSIGTCAFEDCTNLTSVTIPDSVTSVDTSAFYGCTSLTSVSIPASVTSIGYFAFYGCTSLTSVSIPASVTSIGSSVFEGCTSLTSVSIPASVTSIGASAFYGCTSLTSASIPATVTSLGAAAFSGCTSLDGIWVDESNPDYSCDEYGVLFDKNKSELICAPGSIEGHYSIPDSVTSVAFRAFAHCTSLTGIMIPDSVTWLNGSTFEHCTSLTSVTLPASVIFMGKYTFENCDKLTIIRFDGNAPGTGPDDNSFRNVTANAYYPEGNTTWTEDTMRNLGGNITWIPMCAEHKWGEWSVVTEATATTAGEKIRTCGTCGWEETEIIPATGEPVTPPVDDEPVTPPAEDDKPIANPFADVPKGEYYYDSVLWAVDNGITTGMTETTFAPDGTCTRAQIVTFLWRANGSPAPASSNNPFTDVPAGLWYTDAVLWAVEQGITTGTSATTFSPDASCTRGQVATFLYRAQGKPASSGTNVFTDLEAGAYYYDAVLWAVENGITNGMGDGTFAPDATCTRGQIVTFLYRAMA